MQDKKRVRWGAAMLVGIVLLLMLEDVIDPANSDKSSKIYDAAANHSGRMIASALLLLATAALIVPAVWWVVRALPQRGRGAGRVACALAVAGTMGHAALGTLYLVWAELPKGAANRGQMVALVDRISNSGSIVVLMPLIVAFGLTFLTLFIAMHRGGVTPRWVIAPVVLAAILDTVGQGSATLVNLVAFALLLVATCTLAARVNELPAPVAGQPVSTPA